LRDYQLLTGDQAQANRDAITAGGGQYALTISLALKLLRDYQLLTGDQAQANRDAITAGGGQYADRIARALKVLRDYQLLTGDQAQANRDAITVGGGQYAHEIARALPILHDAQLLSTSEQAQANFTAITAGGGQYALEIARALPILRDAPLLSNPEQAQAYFNLITTGGGQYAYNISWSLEELSRAGLLIGDQAQANRDAITAGGGRYAEYIARALPILHAAQLLSTPQRAQAYFNLMTTGGGRYARDMALILEKLRRYNLLRPENAAMNVRLLGEYLNVSLESNHGISFISDVITKNRGLTQRSYELLMQYGNVEQSNVTMTRRQFYNFIRLLNIGVSFEDEKNSVDEPDQIEYKWVARDILYFCEYFCTYLKGKEQTFAQVYSALQPALIAMLSETADLSSWAVINSIFKQLFSNEFSCNADEIAYRKAIMVSIIEMLQKNKQNEASFSIDAVKQIDHFFKEGVGASLSMTERNNGADEYAMQPNERVIILLAMCLDGGMYNFYSAWHVLIKSATTSASAKPVGLRALGFFAEMAGSTEMSGQICNVTFEQSVSVPPTTPLMIR